MRKVCAPGRLATKVRTCRPHPLLLSAANHGPAHTSTSTSTGKPLSPILPPTLAMRMAGSQHVLGTHAPVRQGGSRVSVSRTCLLPEPSC
jgi:hypothetical protein